MSCLGPPHPTVLYSFSLSCQCVVTATSQVVRSSAGRHWYTERLVSVGLLALIPTGLVYPNPVVDYGLAVLVPIHGHWSVRISPR